MSFVCMCAGLTEEDIRRVAAGAADAEAVFARLNEEPRCRTCIPDVERLRGESNGKVGHSTVVAGVSKT